MDNQNQLLWPAPVALYLQVLALSSACRDNALINPDSLKCVGWNYNLNKWFNIIKHEPGLNPQSNESADFLNVLVILMIFTAQIWKWNRPIMSVEITSLTSGALTMETSQRERRWWQTSKPCCTTSEKWTFAQDQSLTKQPIPLQIWAPRMRNASNSSEFMNSIRTIKYSASVRVCVCSLKKQPQVCLLSVSSCSASFSISVKILLPLPSSSFLLLLSVLLLLFCFFELFYFLSFSCSFNFSCSSFQRL